MASIVNSGESRMATSPFEGFSAPGPDSTHSRPSLLILSDAKLFRSGLVAALGDWPFRTIEAAEHAAASQFTAPRWDVILLVISSGADPEKLLAPTSFFLPIPRVVITDRFTFEAYAACSRARIAGLFLEEMPLPALQVSLFLILKGNKIWPTRKALAHLASMEYSHTDDQTMVSAARNRGLKLTLQEIKILRCLVHDGGSNKLLARQLCSTEATIKVHMKSLLRKIGVQNRTQLALWALTNGFAATSFEAAVGETGFLERPPHSPHEETVV